MRQGAGGVVRIQDGGTEGVPHSSPNIDGVSRPQREETRGTAPWNLQLVREAEVKVINERGLV